MGQQTETTTQRAKKEHQCSWCGQKILKCEIYELFRWFSNGDAGTCKLHPECYEDMHKEIIAQGESWLEFSPGDYERPHKELIK